VATLHSFLGLNSDNSFPAESDQGERVKQVKENWKRRWKTLGDKIQKPEKSHDSIDIEAHQVFQSREINNYRK